MNDKHVGFSGTQQGLTTEQVITIDKLLFASPTTIAHHGDCIGADSQFHEIAKANSFYIIGHPPIKSNKRAFCDFDEELSPEEYLDRNKMIVDASGWVIIGPKGYEEELRSGTWSTKRYADKQKKEGYIVWPDGELTKY